MTTDELRAAEAYFRAQLADGGHDDHDVTRFIGHAWVLVKAHLAEHPADSDEPVTLEWLTDHAGFVRPDPTYSRRVYLVCNNVRLHLFPWALGWAAEVRQKLDGDASDIVSLLGVLTTRGDVRRLLAALGAA